MPETNEQHFQNRIGLDKLIDQRNRIVGFEIQDLDLSAFRDEVVLAFDILTQILGEHFPLMQDSTATFAGSSTAESTRLTRSARGG